MSELATTVIVDDILIAIRFPARDPQGLASLPLCPRGGSAGEIGADPATPE